MKLNVLSLNFWLGTRLIELKMTNERVNNIRNIAKVIGALASLFYMFLAFKGGLAQTIQGTGKGLIPFFPFLAIAVAGYLIAYVQEKKGGVFMLIGGITLMLFFLIYSRGVDWARAAAYGIPFVLCGAAFIYCSRFEIKND